MNQPQGFENVINKAVGLWKKNQSTELKEALNLVFDAQEGEYSTIDRTCRGGWSIESLWKKAFGTLPWDVVDAPAPTMIKPPPTEAPLTGNLAKAMERTGAKKRTDGD
jgi:hypothetical protein